MLPLPALPSAPPRPPDPIDANAPAAPGWIYGLDTPLERARIIVVPVPYESTVSSRPGTIDGPRAVLEGSAQVDLFDPIGGEPWRLGLAMLPEEQAVRALSAAARGAADRAREGDESARTAVDGAGREVWAWLEQICGGLLDSSRIPIVLGGEHGVSFGAIRAAATRHRGLGVLQVDAHADLRAGYEGLATSHASVMRRVLELARVSRLVQVGLRDICAEEADAGRASGERVLWYTDAAIASREFAGESFGSIAAEIVAAVPDPVWVSFDIDGLVPSLCPGTGTPVPGGLGWREASYLLGLLGRSGKRVLGADLVEVGAGCWDGFVGAKLLYLLAGVAGGTCI